MIAEDDGVTVAHLGNILTDSGYVPLAVASGEEAIQRAAEARPDLVLMDIRLRGEMDGIEAAEQIHARFGIPVVYLTALPDDESLRQARSAHSSGYIGKPFTLEELRSTIEIALHPDPWSPF